MEIYSLDKVKQMEEKYGKINIICLEEDFTSDSMCFQIQFDDSNRLISLATYYVFQSGSF